MVIAVFIAGLMLCVIKDISIVYALLFGLIVFCINALTSGYSVRQLAFMMISGIKKTAGVISLLLLIGALTGIWRGCGVIPYIVYNSVSLIQPRLFLCSAFLLCLAFSMITGTAFGTASTMGVVLAIMGSMNGINSLYTCGAIMSGSYFGDRASPMSSAARLLCTVTNTDYHKNFMHWMKASAVPFAASIILYILIGSGYTTEVMHVELVDHLAQEFRLHWTLALPAVMLVLLFVLKVKVHTNLAINIISSSLLAVVIQGFTLPQLIGTLLLGFKIPNGILAKMLSGGGVVSMSRAVIIILISAACVGIFEETKVLRGFERRLASLNNRVGAFTTTLITGLVTAAVSCNQTLSIMLTNQLCKGFYTSQTKLASDISSTTVLLAAYIPWSIACTLPLTVIGGDFRCLPFAFFMYLTPLYNLILEQTKRFLAAKVATH